MRKAIFTTLCALALAWGCTEADTDAAPVISTDVCPAYLGPLSMSSLPVVFDLMIINDGDETLVIEQSGVEMLGNDRGSFTWEGPDKYEVEPNSPAFLRVTYNPASEGDDQAYFRVLSNADNAAEFIFPVCAHAYSGDDTGVVPDCTAYPEGMTICGDGTIE